MEVKNCVTSILVIWFALMLLLIVIVVVLEKLARVIKFHQIKNCSYVRGLIHLTNTSML